MIFCWGIRSCNELILEIRTPGVLKICWWNILREILKRFVTADLKMPCLELFLKYFQYFALLVTVILPPEIIKYYRNLFRFTSYMIFFSSFLVTFLWVSITFECYHIHSKCNHANILFNVWFTTYVTFIIFLSFVIMTSLLLRCSFIIFQQYLCYLRIVQINPWKAHLPW